MCSLGQRKVLGGLQSSKFPHRIYTREHPDEGERVCRAETLPEAECHAVSVG